MITIKKIVINGEQSQIVLDKEIVGEMNKNIKQMLQQLMLLHKVSVGENLKIKDQMLIYNMPLLMLILKMEHAKT